MKPSKADRPPGRERGSGASPWGAAPAPVNVQGAAGLRDACCPLNSD